jgi:hypothetical protein
MCKMIWVKRVTRNVHIGYTNDPNMYNISNCLIYNIYLLLCLGSHTLTSGSVY